MGKRKNLNDYAAEAANKIGRMAYDRYTPNGRLNSTRIQDDFNTATKVGKRLFRKATPGRPPGYTPRAAVTISPRQHTAVNTRMRYRGSGAYNTKSGGKLGIRRKPKKPKGWQAGKGVTFTGETGGVLGAQDIVYIGHITGPRDLIFKQAMQSMVKLLLTKMNVRIRDFGAPMNEVKIAPGDLFNLLYKADSRTTVTSSSSFAVLAASTFNDVANSFVTLLSGTTLTDWSPLVLEYVPIGGNSPQFASIGLDQLMLHFDIKSSLKIQNRSINTAGNDQEDDVDNVPLYGKSIGGSGTGVIARFPNSISPANVVGNINNGVISQVNLDDNAKEPLSGYFFPKSSLQGKVHLDPGILKTSVLTTRRNISLKYLVRLFNTGATSPQPLTSFGKYRFFQLEKMIDTGITINLLVAYEHNISMSCYATTKYNWTTAPQYLKI